MAFSERIELRNVCDVHVHAFPSIFERWGDAEQTVDVCQAAGMSGIVLKAHHGSTTELANHLNQKFKIDVFGGVVLNYFVGGLNPYAVDACRALGGKMVWLPTLHAAAHEPLGRFEFQEPKTRKIPGKGIRIANAEGLVEPMHEILDILDGNSTVLATGHVSAEEIKVLCAVLRERRIKVRVLVNHVHFYSPGLDRDDVEALKGENTWFEVSYLSQKVSAAGAAETAQLIKDHPDAKWIMVSDSGQPGNRAPEALRNFRDLLEKQGISADRLDAMMISAPRELLGFKPC